MKFEGKKLLVLGGKSVGSVELVKYAKECGAYVIVTDYLPAKNSPAKVFADQSEMISTTDISALVNFARQEKIDGVFCGVSEINLRSVRAVATELKLPCYFTEEQWELCQNKLSFKELCIKNDVPVAREYVVAGMDDEELDSLDYPVIVKPVDQGAAIGITICHNKEELKKGYALAVEKSYSKRAVVEQYIVGEEFSAAYTIINGEYRLSTIGTKYLDRSQKGMLPLPNAYVYPSKMIDIYNEKINQSVINMFKSIGLENGTVFVQGVTDGKNIALFEAGLRMGGTALFRFVHRINKINILHLLVNYALTGNMDGNVELEDATLKGKKCCLLSLLNGGGKIGKICGVEQASEVEGVVETIVRYKEGETVPKSGTLHQSHIRFFVVRDSYEQLKESIEKIQAVVRVYDENGQDMLLTGFDAEELLI